METAVILKMKNIGWTFNSKLKKMTNPSASCSISERWQKRVFPPELNTLQIIWAIHVAYAFSNLERKNKYVQAVQTNYSTPAIWTVFFSA